MDNYIILKYLQGKATKIEKEQFFNWLEQSPKNKEEFVALKKIWALTEKHKNSENITWTDLKQPLINEQKTRKLFLRYVRNAAVFLLLIGLGAVSQYFIGQNSTKTQFQYDKNSLVKSPLGQMTDLELPDGTLVKLNSGTTISYNSEFSYGKREVYIEGEAFFDVQTDKEHPFIVKSKLLDVKVYGTMFNICSYPADKNFTATLVEGSISVLSKTGKEITKIEPGYKAEFVENGANVLISNVDTVLYTSWKRGLVTFRNQNLEEIAKQIERWYNVEIIIEKEGLGKERYFGTILKNKPIDQILEVLKLTTSLQYEIIPRADKPTLIYWK